jgi:hypothetical protein
MASLFDRLKERNPDLLFAFYCLLLFFLNFGPNTTTYVLSAEVENLLFIYLFFNLFSFFNILKKFVVDHDTT